MTFDDAVARLSGRIGDGRRDRTALRSLLAELGNPQSAFPAIHVAGTNGKGSTVAFLSAILKEAGLCVGAYLSPFVFDIRERWMLGGQPISEASFIEAVTHLGERETPGALSEFELKTAVAFLAFARSKVDIAIIEAGIGGLRDATNVIAPPLAAIVTNVGLDHVGILGATREEIAREKAGIFKPGTNLFLTAEPPGAVREVLEKAAREAGGALTFSTEADLPSDAELGLKGAYQRANAALAARTARSLEISEAAILRGLAGARLPGRFQVFQQDGKTLILDVAHNEGGALALKSALDEAFPARPLVLVLGMSRSHDPLPFLQALGEGFVRAVATEPPFRPRPAAETADVLRARGLATVENPAARDAIESAWSLARPGEVVLVTGSFYIVGEAPAQLRGTRTPGTIPL